MMKKIIFTESAPMPIGPYSQATLVANTLYTSGQIALHPITMELVTSDIETETKQVMENLKAVLMAANMTFEDVIKTTIYVMDMSNFVRINNVYSSYFNEKTAPARETIQVAGLPKEANVEISVIAFKN